MSRKELSTKKVAAAACAVGIVLFSAACSSTVGGTATYSGEGATTTSEEETTTSDDEETTTSDEEESTGSEPSTDPDNPPAAAPDQPYQYDNGVTLTLSAPVQDDTLSGLISDEFGFVVNLTMENPSSASFDMSQLPYNLDVNCPASTINPDQYILNKSSENGGPDTLAAGQTGTYRIEIGVKTDAVGTECLVTIIFTSPDFDNIDPALFTITF